MPDKAISELDSLSPVADDDLVAVVDISDTTMSGQGTIKKAVKSELISGLLKLDQTSAQTITNDSPIFNILTVSELLATDANKKLQSLAVATYPSLTEISYIKGLSSAVQTQLNGKQDALGFTPENVANKKTTLDDNSDTYYPSQKAVKTAVDANLPLAGGTMTGEITLGENAAIVHDNALSADGKYTGEIINGTAGATLAFGDLVYLDPTDSRWELADANVITAADGDCRGILAICVLAAANDGSATKLLLRGMVRADAVFPTFTVNAQVYVSETAGDVTETQPTTADVAIRVVGFGFDGNTLYFCPSNDYITHS